MKIRMTFQCSKCNKEIILLVDRGETPKCPDCEGELKRVFKNVNADSYDKDVAAVGFKMMNGL